MTEQEIEQRERYARAIGRIAFGALMLAGVAILLRRMHDTPVAKVNEVIASIWIAAAFWGFVAMAPSHSRPTRTYARST